MLAGVVTAVVGFASSFALVLTGLTAKGATTAQAASGLLGLLLAMAVGILVLALRYRIPLTLAWSTPGAALLAGAAADGAVWSAAVGTFLLAGVLLPICVTAFTTLGRTSLYAAPILLTWLVGYAFARRWAVPLALLAALVVVALTLDATPTAAALVPRLTWTAPTFDWRLLLGLGIPLFLVNIASQYAPGVAVMKTYGYTVPWRPTMLATAAVSAVVAPAGGHAVNLAAISAALSASPEAHPDPRRRWVAAVSAAGSYVVLGLLSAAAAFVLTHSPRGLVITVAALALLGPLGSALERCLADPDDREAAVVALVATASGLSLFGIGAAFWGLASGLLVRTLLRAVRARRAR